MTKPKVFGENQTRRSGREHPSWRGGRRIVNGYWMVAVKGHPRGTGQAGYVSEHILIVEAVLGHRLPEAAEVHHVDQSKRNNAHNNLVACQDRAYHALLHQRQRALDACGDADARRCCRCRGYDRQGDIHITYRGVAYHRDCQSRYMRQWHKKQRVSVTSA